MKILITGATSGIAFLTGCVLAERGHDVFLTSKTEEETKELDKKMAYLNLNVTIFKLDITLSSDCLKIKSINPDVLFLHAGVRYSGLLSDIDINLVKDNFEVNVFSNLGMIQNYLSLTNPKNKKVVMTSSLIANHAYPFFGSYTMTKTCIEIMMRILRNESIFNDNQFIIIRPGAYQTGFNEYMILAGEKSNLNPNIRYILNKIFLMIESKNLNSIVYKIVFAIEKGNRRIYAAPLLQTLLSKLTF